MKLNFLTTNKYITINMLKASLAMAIAYFIGLLLDLIFHIQDAYLWIIFIVFALMSTQPNLSGALDVAWIRLIGTLLGGLVAILIMFFFENKIIELFICAPFVILFVYLAGMSPKLTLAGVLGCITLILPIIGNNTNIEAAIIMVAEITLSTIIVLIVDKFVFPIRAVTRLRQSYANTVLQVKEFFNVSFSTEDNFHKNLVEPMFGEFIKQMRLLKEIEYEDSIKLINEYDKMGQYVRKLYRYSIIMYEYLENSTPKKIVGINEAQAFVQFRQSIIKSLTTVYMCMNKRKKIIIEELINYEDDISPLLSKIKLLQDSENFIFYTKAFVSSLRKAVIKYNDILEISKH